MASSKHSMNKVGFETNEGGQSPDSVASGVSIADGESQAATSVPSNSPVGALFVVQTPSDNDTAAISHGGRRDTILTMTSEDEDPSRLTYASRKSCFSSTLMISGDDATQHVSLLYSTHERLRLKVFKDSDRELKMFERMVSHLYLILDMHVTHADVIMKNLVRHMMSDFQNDETDLEKIEHSLYTHDKLHQLCRTVQTTRAFAEYIDYDHNWIAVISTSGLLKSSRVGIVRLRKPANINRNCQECLFVLLILTPTKLVGKKAEFDKVRILGTLFSDPSLRTELYQARGQEAFTQHLRNSYHALAQFEDTQKSLMSDSLKFSNSVEKFQCAFMKGIIGDLRRRWPHYWSDYTDGLNNRKSVGKTVSCTMLLYFICLLPSMAFGVLNASHTEGALTVEKVLVSQTLGGLLFAVVGGTPQIVLMTTAPLAIYAETIFELSHDFGVNFKSFYGWVGLWNVFFLTIYSIFGLSSLMNHSTRCTEEIFAFFISIAFCVDAILDTVHNFQEYFMTDQCQSRHNRSEELARLCRNGNGNGNGTGTGGGGGGGGGSGNGTWYCGGRSVEEAAAILPECQMEVSMLYLLLILGTVWTGITLYNFTRTPYLTPTKRELIADYSLPIAVIVMTLGRYFVFKDINMSKSFTASPESLLTVADLTSLTTGAFLGSIGLGFGLSLLFFMDQNITGALVNSPQNKLKKGSAFHWDLLVVACINIVPSLLTLPMVHAALPHSPLCLHALADVEERVVDGHVTYSVVRVRETRMAAIFSHVLIGASLFISHYLAYIPRAVLYGLFLYVAITPLYDNQLFERILLLFTEEGAYPPTSYIRRVPLNKVHLFTFLQLFQLVVLCVMGFAGQETIKMLFPVLIFLLIPFRHFIMPYFINEKDIAALDNSM